MAAIGRLGGEARSQGRSRPTPEMPPSIEG
jgi:hypothetical protein